MTVQSPWTERVDQALLRLEAMSAAEAAGRTGIGREVITLWRRKRRRGEAIHEVRGANAEALLRFLEEGFRTGRIPAGVRARMRTLRSR